MLGDICCMFSFSFSPYFLSLPKKKKRFSPTKTTFLGLTFSCGGNFSLRGNQKNTVCVCVTNTHTSNSVRTCETCWIIVTRALDVPGTADWLQLLDFYQSLEEMGWRDELGQHRQPFLSSAVAFCVCVCVRVGLWRMGMDDGCLSRPMMRANVIGYNGWPPENGPLFSPSSSLSVFKSLTLCQLAGGDLVDRVTTPLNTAVTRFEG